MAENLDPRQLTLVELRALRAKLQNDDDAVSYVRRLAQARLDLLQAEKRRRTEGDPHQLSDELSNILSAHLTGGVPRPPRPAEDFSSHPLAEQFDALADRTLWLRSHGLRTALVTNNVREFGDGWRSLVPVDELFDVVIDSSHAGVRKPDPRIFRLALDALDVTPEQSLFLDDFPGNIAAAGALGMRGILVGTDRLAAIAELDTLLGEA